jgi:hypothetical protein
MNRRTRNVFLISALLIAACHGRERSSYGPDRATTITRSFPAAAVRNVRVFEVGGTIRVEPGPVQEITLTASAKGRLKIKPQAENQGLFETVIVGDTLRIGRREHKRGFNFNFFFDRDDVRIDYVLYVPPTVSLDLRTVNGRIATRGMDGETDASTVNGSIDVEVSGMHGLSATSVNGRVRATFTQSFQGAQFKSVNGGVEAILPKDASFSVDLAQVNGDFEAAFPLSIHSQPGSRRVSGEVNGGQHRLKIVTVNGDVELAQLNPAL